MSYSFGWWKIREKKNRDNWKSVILFFIHFLSSLLYFFLY